MAGAADVVWVDVLPSMRRFGPELESGTGTAAAAAGQKAGTNFSSGFSRYLKIGAAIGGAMAASAGISFMKEAVKEASNLGESLNAVAVTYGENAKGIEDLGKRAADSFGLSQSQFNGLAVQFSAFATSIAGEGGDVVGTIDALATRGADFASVMNLEVNDAMALFQSGLAGETEPLRKFGIDLSAAAVEAYAYANGIAAAGEPLTEQQKVQARYASLMEQTNKTQGDFINTSDSLANSQRILSANWDDIQAKVGARVIPTLERLSGWVLKSGLPLLSQLGAYADQAFGIMFKGDFKGGPLSEDSWLVDKLFDIREGLAGLDFSSVSGFFGSLKDSGPGAAASFGSIGGSLVTLAPAIGEFITGVREAGSSALPILSGALEFLARHVDTIIRFMPILVGLFVAFQIATRVASVVVAANTTVVLANNVARIAAARAERTAAIARGVSTGQVVANTTAETVNGTVRKRNLLTLAAQRVAMVAAAAASAVMTGAQWLLNAAMSANPIGILIVVLVALVAAVVIAYRESETFRNIVDRAWKGIQDAVKYAWENVIKPAFSAIVSFLRDTLAPAALWLWNNVIKPAFRGIGDAISIAWNVIKLIFDVWVWYLKNVVAPVITWVWKNIVKPAFEGISSAIKWAWDNVIKPVLQALGDFITGTVAPAFEKGVSAIGRAWDEVMELARKPVNFVIETVYNQGIRKAFNTLAEAVGSDARLPYANQVGVPRSGGGARGVQALARGGYAPPGMKLVGEEGPELVDFHTPGRVYTAKQTRDLMGIGGPMDRASDIVSGLSSMLTDPLGFVKRQVSSVLEQIPGAGTFGTIVKAIPPKMLELVKEKIDSLFSFADGFTGGSGAWRRPGAGRVSSEFGMRRNPVSGVYKLHNGIDLAAGMGSPVLAAAAGQVLSAGRSGGYGNFIQLGHGPGLKTGYAHLSSILARAGQIVTAGQLIGREGSTGNSTGPHLHFNVNKNGSWVNPRSIMSFDEGGMLPMGVHQIAHAGARPDRVLTSRQWDDISALANRGAEGSGYPDRMTLLLEDGTELRGFVRREASKGSRHDQRMYQGA